MKTAWIAGAVALLTTARADASPLSDAIARHNEADVTTLRAQLPGDAQVRCTLGAVYAKRNDVTRAMLYLEDCGDAELPEDIAMDIVRATRDVKKKLEQLSQLNIVTDPPGMVVTLDALENEKLTSPVTVWIKAGTHTVRAGEGTQQIHNSIKTEPHGRSTIYLGSGVRVTPPPKDTSVDFTEENATEQTSGPPPDVVRPSLVKGKYAGELGPAGEQLEDPLAWRASAGPRPWFGLRVGGGMYDDGAASSSWRPSLAAAARFGLATRVFLAARLDWSRRGGSSDTAVDSVGASFGAGYTALASRSFGVALIGQLRGDLRFADTRNMMAVSRAGAAVAAGAEVAFAGTPLTAGIRFEQGLTELVPGARDRALLVEVGVDWR